MLGWGEGGAASSHHPTLININIYKEMYVGGKEEAELLLLPPNITFPYSYFMASSNLPVRECGGEPKAGSPTPLLVNYLGH